MKLSITTVTLITLFQSTLGFAPVVSPSFGLATTTAKTTTAVFADPGDDEEEGGLDLNLEEMFDMFDAADKGEDFDEAIKEVKKN